MIRHFLILSSSYSEGKRIAMHYIVDEKMDAQLLIDEVRKVKEHCGETVSISTHFIETDSDSWQSVVDKDAFFENVTVVETLFQFINLITNDRLLTGLDVAKYILSTAKMTHLKLEKLVYFCYAEYLCLRHKKLFDDDIFAFRYGPVVESVYKKYKGSRQLDIEKPARSRILFAQDGIEKLAVIDDTLRKYGYLSSTALVNITHTSGSPWDMVDSTTDYATIPDEVILAHHKKEIQCFLSMSSR